jgi:hypothetical protein
MINKVLAVATAYSLVEGIRGVLMRFTVGEWKQTRGQGQI